MPFKTDLRWSPDLNWSDVTPKAAYLNRRQIIAAAGAMAVAGPAWAKSQYSTDEAPNTLKEISTYNNYYEFGTGKEDPSQNAGGLKTAPWSVVVDGMVAKPGTYDLGDLIAGLPVEERIYRMRCVEAWSMIIPWQGFQLSSLIDKLGPQPGAKYVAFETLVRPEEMNGVQSRILDWPYREGLRMDEAMHPLALIATGLYGAPLPNQNGAPIRLVTPWKYGFKGVKAIVKISFVGEMPQTTWNMMAANEYGFYANVNPGVDHPRWSQASERRIGAGLFAGRQDTLIFNGYGDQVASLYGGMDLAANY